jgi:hypothetical protein
MHRVEGAECVGKNESVIVAAERWRGSMWLAAHLWARTIA